MHIAIASPNHSPGVLVQDLSTIIRCPEPAHPGILLTQTDCLVLKSCLVVAENAAGTTFASLGTTIFASHSDLLSWNDSRCSKIIRQDECADPVIHTIVSVPSISSKSQQGIVGLSVGTKTKLAQLPDWEILTCSITVWAAHDSEKGVCSCCAAAQRRGARGERHVHVHGRMEVLHDTDLVVRTGDAEWEGYPRIIQC